MNSPRVLPKLRKTHIFTAKAMSKKGMKHRTYTRLSVRIVNLALMTDSHTAFPALLDNSYFNNKAKKAKGRSE